MASVVSLDIAGVHRGRGNDAKALSILSETVERFPETSSTYAMMSMIHRDAGEIDKAIEILLEGNTATDGQSAELNYFLGLMFLEKGDLDSAKTHAILAYNFGYPLPGLARKLNRRGVSLH